MEEDSDIIQWHKAFHQAIQLELEEYRDVLTFEIERELTAAPLKVDVLIIKKRKNVVIKKNIARIFQQRNIVEYKSPDDYVSIDDYNKVRSYALLYASQQHVDTDELSVTFISERKPIKLLKYLAKRYTVKRQQPGIYIVERDICPLQIIVSRELSDEENLWINGLTKHLTAVRLLRIIRESHLRGKGAAVGAYVNVVSDANDKVFDEVTMGRTLEQILEQKGFADRFIAKGEARGRVEGETRAGRNAVVAILRRRFTRVPKALEAAIRQLNDPVVLDPSPSKPPCAIRSPSLKRG
ncbi:hypothetical protein FACS1894170_05350 [Planctomycetales bacterium]|nr:hypothetical protein FACS1894170_05350 [Planctomycetales bacterium]